MTTPSFYSNVPLYIFTEKGISPEASRLLLYYFQKYTLHGVKGFIDEDGNKSSHKFEEVLIEDTFLVPTAIFLFSDKDELSLEHVHAYVYLCYLSHLQKKHIVKINKELVKGATGLSKTRFFEVVQELIFLEGELIEATGKSNSVSIPWLTKEHINTIELVTENFKAIQNGEKEPENGVQIPTYLLHNHKQLGFSYRDLGIIVTLASVVSEREISLEEAIQEVVQNTNKNDNLDPFQVLGVIRNAEKKGIFDLIKERDGNVTIHWKEPAVN